MRSKRGGQNGGSPSGGSQSVENGRANCPGEVEQVNCESPNEAPDGRSEWLRKLDEECPYQVVLPRGPGDGEIMNFLNAYVGQFDMYAEDEYAVFVRYCFADPLDAAIFRSRFEFKSSRLRLAG